MLAILKRSFDSYLSTLSSCRFTNSSEAVISYNLNRVFVPPMSALKNTSTDDMMQTRQHNTEDIKLYGQFLGLITALTLSTT